MAGTKILVVEDEQQVAGYIESCLKRFDYNCAGSVRSGKSALMAAAESKPDLVLMDISLEGEIDGVETARRIQSLNIPVLYITGSAEETTLTRAMQTEPAGYLVKPFEPIDLRVAIESALIQHASSKRRAEDATRQTELKFRALFESIAEGVFRSSPSGEFLLINPALARMLGYSTAEDLMRSVKDIRRQLYVDPTRRLELERLMNEKGSVKGFESELCRRDGSTFWARENVRAIKDERGNVVCYEGIIEDISDRKKGERERALMEIQLQQALKLEAVGQLAAGIAHEINTPTQYVGDNTRFLQDAFADLSKILECCGQLVEARRAGKPDTSLFAELETKIREADLAYLNREIPRAVSQSLEGVARVAKIVRAMKEFSHPGGDEKQSVDLNHAIESTITVCRNEWKYVAEMVTDLEPDLPMVPCLPDEFNQVILNLIINAAHAIGDVIGSTENTKGTITIRTRSEGNWVEIRVSDTGTGIPLEARPKIFTPFFTTKEIGKGTGQGLAISRAVIVGKHGGTIDFETAVGRGTTFIIRLPLTPSAASSDAHRISAEDFRDRQARPGVLSLKDEDTGGGIPDHHKRYSFRG